MPKEVLPHIILLDSERSIKTAEKGGEEGCKGEVREQEDKREA